MRNSRHRQPLQCVAASVALMLTVVLVPLPAVAQDRAQQRAMCEDEARWLCSNYGSDEEAIKACMLRNLRSLSPRCRAMFGKGAKQRTRN